MENLPYIALGMFKSGNIYKLMVIRYNDQLETKVEEVKVLDGNKDISKDMFRVNVIEYGIFK